MNETKNVFFLFLASFLVLFIELTLIRYLSANIHLLSYFANTVLLASFLGMGLGCLLKEKYSIFDYLFPVILLVTVSIAVFFYYKNIHLSLGYIASKTDVFFGYIFYPRRVLKLPVYPVLGTIFILVTLILILPGKYLAIYFEKFKPLIAYKINILGSIAGIIIFFIFSYFSIGPFWWFLLGIILTYLLVSSINKKSSILWIICLAIILFEIYKFDYSNKSAQIKWSPYYKVHLCGNVISVNNMNHQQMQNPSAKESFIYNFPYILMNQAGKQFKNVLIIGAGSGNDVAAAILNKAEHIDAVEIDPVIGSIGKTYHPIKPYSSDIVTLYFDDGRSFLKKTDKKYDLIIYALVDSLTMLSTYSNIRLENYLFTTDAFYEIKNRLNEKGAFIIYNTFRENWLAIKIFKMLGSVFNSEPFMTVCPAMETISETAKPHESLTTFVIEKNDNKIKNLFSENKLFLLSNLIDFNTEPKVQFIKKEDLNITALDNAIALYETKIIDNQNSNFDYATDDWPFLYLRNKTIPLHNIIGIILILVLSSLFILTNINFNNFKKDNIAFLLFGAAFMLLETKSITVFALAFGTTWTVNSIVFFGILTIGFFSNLFIINYPKTKYGIIYVGIVITLLISYFVPVKFLLALPVYLKFIFIIIITFLPIFFGSMLFSKFFNSGSNSVTNLGFNLFGVIVGGLLENISLITGYNNLIILILIIYLSTFLFREKKLV